uniref:F-box domain-containing protein n=1 Tax=Heterorhabditis bacteriophora TaxID=37862 RepID=A0A1I7XGU6_HETBA
MPFMGRDWRAPGETWVRTPHTNGWERCKLRPIQICSEAIPIPGSLESEICHTNSSTSLLSLDSGRSSSISDDSTSEIDESWIPHCFVKSKSKEFIGCTSMSEAFHRLDLARAVSDVRRFNYICKVVQILVHEKLQNLSATARKSLLGILTAIVLRTSEEDVHLSTARDLVQQFGAALEGHVCGSPQLVSRHQHTAHGLLEVITDRQPRTAVDAEEQSTTFLDLPTEILSLVLRRLPDDRSLLETAKAHDALQALIDGEGRLWQSLCEFHFQPYQIQQKKTTEKTWRQTFFDLKRYFGVREVYADLVHICCHCKALFWKSLGHPCVREDSAPSVRVTPGQFVDMLIYL